MRAGPPPPAALGPHPAPHRSPGTSRSRDHAGPARGPVRHPPPPWPSGSAVPAGGRAPWLSRSIFAAVAVNPSRLVRPMVGDRGQPFGQTAWCSQRPLTLRTQGCRRSRPSPPATWLTPPTLTPRAARHDCPSHRVLRADLPSPPLPPGDGGGSVSGRPHEGAVALGSHRAAGRRGRHAKGVGLSCSPAGHADIKWSSYKTTLDPGGQHPG